ncbi:MAG: NAD(P)/FAD-dependent oxidoreductase [Alphaproteobacteria bacterium]
MRTHPLETALWAETAQPAPETHPLEGEARADVAVVGAGYTGLSTALHLARRGVRVVVLEAEEIGYGASGRNASMCSPTFLHQEPDDVVRLLGPKFGPRMVRLQADAAELVFGLIRTYGMDCEAAQNGIIYAAHTPGKLASLERRNEQYARWGKPCRMLSKDEVADRTGSDKYHGGWLHPEGGHINPLGYARGLARAALEEGARIHTRSPVRALTPSGTRWRAETPTGAVTADKVVVATDAYTGELWPKLGAAFFMLTAFNVASAPLSENVRRTVLPYNNNVIDTRKDSQYYKLDKDGRLVAGSVAIWRRGFDEAYSRDMFTRRFRYLFPQLGEVDWRWHWYGYLAMVPNRLARLVDLAPGVMAAYGYSGRGVPTATAMGPVLAAYAAGVPKDELAVPVTRLEPVLTRKALSFLVPKVFGPLYQWMDARAMRKDGLTPPRL